MFRFTENVIGQMTLNCNLRCKYCYEGDKIKNQNSFLSVPDFKKALDTWIYQRCILGNVNNKINWHFHGGEPLLYNFEDFKECVRYIERRKEYFPNINWCIQTNGTCLTEEKAAFFAEKKMSVGVSFDGFNSPDRFSRETAEELIKNLYSYKNKYGLNYSCLSTLSKDNMETWFSDMQGLKDLFNSFGINILVPPEGQEYKLPSSNELWHYWIDPCLNSYLTNNPLRERLIQLCLESFITYDVLTPCSNGVVKSGCFDRICGHGVNMISITPDLKVHNCDKYLEEGPFIKNRSECKINSRDFLGLQQIRDYTHYCDSLFKLEEKTGCTHCPTRKFCLGGCQSYNLSRYGEVKFDTFMCDIYKKIFEFFKLNWIDIIKNNPIIAVTDILDIRPSYERELQEAGYYPVVDMQENSLKIIPIGD